MTSLRWAATPHAIRLLNQLGNRLGIMLPLPSLFEARTIAELASRLDRILMRKALRDAGRRFRH